ncbi:hypothetical protein TTHERM_001087961 (macronuclear) [Tetrahymena thermophila SB210]|uniref:Uncharacterized protein n=1 Tax=Tetrahymena thermophila (strain SB210) TaxID=312017 RepID=W7XJ85_TETTS|nr:hypothetical protein TTHERM_001087961 [Tetrahymena thermophila SB210]EWS73944.1 hypothetical protein TTHERM_001087961 [Tetrahymena thermophila SB210]|eukprot:XP_012653525.1 hypothetical protein TTHERM_001087961 [Tetrahymena thermophila SB210]
MDFICWFGLRLVYMERQVDNHSLSISSSMERGRENTQRILTQMNSKWGADMKDF